MRRRSSSFAEAAAVVVAFVALVASCVTPSDTGTVTKQRVEVAPELAVVETCDVIVDVGDAAARGNLVARRHDYEIAAVSDGEAAFGARLALATPEERFRAFHAERLKSPLSTVGAYGECLVYANWPKMADEAKKACAAAAAMPAMSAVLVDVARADSALVHDADSAAAIAIADAAIARSPTCAALHVSRARAIAARGDAVVSRDAWASASAAAPKCFRCLVEQAALEERLDTGPAGRATASSLWERALRLAPDHADTLRRFAAATAGVDDARALRAWEAAVKAGARDYPTLLAVARLSTTLATTPAEYDAAMAHARRAAEAAREDPEPRRLLIESALKKGALDDAAAAARAVLALVPDDVLGNAAMARVAVARGVIVDAVVGYDAAVKALDAGAAYDVAGATTIRAEQRGLLERLGVDDSKRPKGSATAVANHVQRALQNLWRTRIKTKGVTKGGVLVVVVETNADGSVASSVVKADAVGDAEVAAAALAWLNRANISGGARRHTLEFTLQ